MRARTAALTTALALALTGCGGTGSPPAPGTVPATSDPSGPTSTEAERSPLDAGAPTPTAETASPTWDEDAASTAAGAGAAAVAAFLRKDLDPAAWAARLAPLLSDAAAAAYLGPDPAMPSTDPANVPGTGVTGRASAAPGPSPYLAAVTVGTDAGGYVVLLSRTGGAAGWLVERFVLPTDPQGTGGP